MLHFYETDAAKMLLFNGMRKHSTAFRLFVSSDVLPLCPIFVQNYDNSGYMLAYMSKKQYFCGVVKYMRNNNKQHNRYLYIIQIRIIWKMYTLIPLRN